MNSSEPAEIRELLDGNGVLLSWRRHIGDSRRDHGTGRGNGGTGFALLAGAKFLSCCATRQLVVLATILRDAGMSDAEIGLVTAAPGWALIPATLFGGAVVARFGAARVAFVGLVLTLISFASLQLTYDSALAAAGSRLAWGIAFGLFLPASVAFVRSRASERQEVHWIGAFTAMQILPSLFAPALAEKYLAAFGPGRFFVIMSTPIVGAILLAFPLLRGDRPPARAEQRRSYLALIRDPRLVAPLFAISVFGMASAFASAFLALLLREHGVAVGAFFTTFAATVLTVRFALLRWLQRLPQLVLLEGALLVIAAEFGLLAAFVTPASVICAGVLFGFGYAVIFPTATNWAARLFPEAERARPIALTTSGFHAGALAAPLIAGCLLGRTGWPTVLGTLALGTAIAAVGIAMKTVRRHS